MQIIKRRDKYSSLNSVDKFVLPLLEREIILAINKIASNKQLSNQKMFLDVGCGNQPFRTHVESTGLRYRSLDVQQNDKKNVDFIFAIDKPFHPSDYLFLEQYDIILFSEVAEHVYDLRLTFLNLSKMLKPGGELIFSSPFVYGLHEEPNDYWRLTNYAIERLALENSFEIVEAKKLGDGWDVLGTVIGLNSIVPTSNSVLSRIYAYSTIKFRNLIWKCLSSEKFRSHVKFSETNHSIYLSNFYIFRRL